MCPVLEGRGTEFMEGKKKRLLFIYNPIAGKGKIKVKLSEVLEQFSASGYEVIVHPTDSQGDARRTALEYAKEHRWDRIVCAGGDGTFSETAGGVFLSGEQVPLGYVPEGTTNDFAYSLKLPVDMDRVYLTGLSMGGTGTWMLAMAEPKRFAAIAPICGSGIYWNAGMLKNIPVMVYHGDCDETVPLSNSIEMVKGVNKNGCNAEIKILYGVSHNAWDAAYQGDELYTWLLSHKRKKEQ